MFKHALTQDVAYTSLLLARRRLLHRLVGEAIEGLYSDRLSEQSRPWPTTMSVPNNGTGRSTTSSRAATGRSRFSLPRRQWHSTIGPSPWSTGQITR